ncbi:hypothetical protein ABK040_007149 [Willaertia magna]
MSFTAFFNYQTNLKPTWKKYYISYSELKESLLRIKDAFRKKSNESMTSALDTQQERTSLLHNNSNPHTPIHSINTNSVQPMHSDNIHEEETIEYHQEEDKEEHTIKIVDNYFQHQKIEIEENVKFEIKRFMEMFKKDVETVYKKYNNEIKRLKDRIKRNKIELENARGTPFFTSEIGPVLKEKFITIYRDLEFLYSFLHANRIACNNLLDKFTFCSGKCNELKQWYNSLPNSNFNTKELKETMESIESIFSKYFTFEDRDKALASLRQPNTHHSQLDSFKLALCIGMVIPLALMIVFMWFFREPLYDKFPGFFDVLPIYRSTMLYIMYGWLYGLNLYIWERNRVNFAYLFEFHPMNHLKYIKVWKTASVLTVFWFVFFFLYLATVKNYLTILDAKWYPLTMGLVLIFIAVLPMHVFHLSARYTLLQVLGKLLITPFGEIKFKHFFVADILTSMVIPITDTSYMLCYYFSNAWSGQVQNKCPDLNKVMAPLLTFLPFFWRLLQCCRRFYDDRTQKSQLLNALKYLCALLVIIFNTLHVNLERADDWGPFRWIWIFIIPVSTLYAFTWDILMDWGLFTIKRYNKTTDTNNSILTKVKRILGFEIVMRNRRLYRNKGVYRLAILFNCIARFAWAGTISTFSKQSKEYLNIVFGSIELCRRCNWSVYRLEWAAISNDEGFRKHVTVPGMKVIDSSKK